MGGEKRKLAHLRRLHAASIIKRIYNLYPGISTAILAELTGLGEQYIRDIMMNELYPWILKRAERLRREVQSDD